MKKPHKIISVVLVCVLALSCISVLPASAAEKDSPGGLIPECALLFHNTLKWDKVFVYGWDAYGNNTLGEWPGTELSVLDKDDFNCDTYNVSLPYGTENIMFSDGDIQQTNVITDFDPEGGGYYLDPEKIYEDNNGFSGYDPLPYGDLVYDYIIGDTDRNGIININDVTAVQKYLAQAKLPDTFNAYAADVDQSTLVKINDATLIQDFLAGIDKKDSCCNTVKLQKPSGIGWVVDFDDYFNWGKISVIARDINGKYLPNADVTKSEYFDSYAIAIPEETEYLTVISEDGKNRTVPNKGQSLWWGFYPVIYVAWDKPNSQYVLDSRTSGGLLPEINFINSLNWEHVIMIEWDKYGNVINQTELDSTKKKSTAYPDLITQKVAFSNGEGEMTDYITGFYAVPGQGDTYILDKTKTTVNDTGKTVYVPVKCSDGEGYTSFKFINTLGWENLYMFAWDDDGKAVSGEWPGMQLKDHEKNAYGQEVYTVEVPGDAVGVIIHNGEGLQTDTITDFDPEGYYLDESVQTDGSFGKLYVPISY